MTASRIMLMLVAAQALFSPALASEPAAGARQRALVTLPDDPEARRAREDWLYADAVLSGDTAYLSGIIALPAEGDPSPEAAFDKAFGRLARRLARVGCSWDDVVEMTSFHTDIDAQLPAFKAMMRKYIRPPYLAWTAIGVSRLAVPSGVAEIKLVAKDCTGRNPGS
ncbi:MAG TPA: Rid family hydrolase [Sphingopyxis sp.]|nr:Rid family hydrolase [Sphingopyxis sp.]